MFLLYQCRIQTLTHILINSLINSQSVKGFIYNFSFLIVIRSTVCWFRRWGKFQWEGRHESERLSTVLIRVWISFRGWEGNRYAYPVCFTDSPPETGKLRPPLKQRVRQPAPHGSPMKRDGLRRRMHHNAWGRARTWLILPLRIIQERWMRKLG
jgi:hypothetical protein